MDFYDGLLDLDRLINSNQWTMGISREKDSVITWRQLHFCFIFPAVVIKVEVPVGVRFYRHFCPL